MPDSFDPYQQWLRIPLKEQPPDHYTLLGLRRFEADEEAIEAAASQRMKLLRQFQTGEHMLESQELLNEVAQARACLRNPEQRQEYDAELREQIERLDLPPLPKAVELVPKKELPMRAPDHIRYAIPEDPAKLLRPPEKRKAVRRQIPIWGWFALLGILSLVILFISLVVQLQF